LYRIDETGYPVEVSSTSQGGANTWSAGVSPQWLKADDVLSDGVAAVSWKADAQDDNHARLYYPSGGEIREMELNGGSWGVGSFRSSGG